MHLALGTTIIRIDIERRASEPLGGGGDLITEFPFTKEMVKSLMQHRSTSGMKKQSKCGHIDTPTEATKLGKK